MFENNKLTKLLNIKYPIIQGGMAGVSESTLVAAVSNAGGMGVIGSGFASPEWLSGGDQENQSAYRQAVRRQSVDAKPERGGIGQSNH